ncbi:LysR family transcriptional regulator [Vibrio parahaemolyticus]|nr:LysR family transcriptional regulator [Vibrio parahaemolyticus]EHU4958603.1 LysR family transcriptional regulator [Vibrio parahaemolyticus]EJG0650904.1 LysR family transcriptional regulator [Vibrio parahaemolyticus]EJG0768229.1 LysR family transcriptional regulator [Vibrio parahaemolyticus]EJG0800779.1 LysR family transcriptional regulator [Vibrio parahaemolyticus]
MLNEKSFIDKDLNLLILLVTLYDEQSTSKTAERLFVTQSAISKGLRKLREQLNDPLFVRSRDGFVPTEKCSDLVSKIGPLLTELENVYSDSSQLLTKDYAGELSIAISSAMYFALSETIYLQLKNDFPSATIRIVNWSESTEQQILNTKIHIGINYHPIDVSKDLVREPLLPVSFNFIARKDHPLSQQLVCLEDISRFPLVVSVIPNFTTKNSKIEHTLHKLKLRSNIVLRSDNANLCLSTLKDSNALMPVNHLFAQKTVQEHEHIKLKTSFDINNHLPSMTLGLFYSNTLASGKLSKLVISSLKKAINTQKTQ